MCPKDKPQPHDRELFRQAMNDVRPLQQDKVKPYQKRPRATPRHSLDNEHQVLVDMMSDHFEPHDLQTGEELHFTRTGLQSSVIRKLKRGQYKIEAELDLHGLNVEAARNAVHSFLVFCQEEDRRCVRIIHGKGLSSRHKGPVLKKMVNRWLQQRKEVLGFTSALPHHGGTGAIYVLLKRQRP